MYKNGNKQSGFTLVEMITVSLITGILVASIMMFTVTYLRNSSVSEEDNVAFVDRMNASDYLRENVGVASDLMSQPRLADENVDVSVEDPDNEDYWRPIYPVENAQINASDADISPILYFRKFSRNTSGDLVDNGAERFHDNFVLYLQRDGKLRMRSIANPNMPDNALKSTCPDNIASSGTCTADKVVLEGVDWVRPRFFSGSGTVVNYASIDELGNIPCTSPAPDYIDCRGSGFSSAKVMELTIHISRSNYSTNRNVTQSSSIIRVALRNSEE